MSNPSFTKCQADAGDKLPHWFDPSWLLLIRYADDCPVYLDDHYAYGWKDCAGSLLVVRLSSAMMSIGCDRRHAHQMSSGYGGKCPKLNASATPPVQR